MKRIWTTNFQLILILFLILFYFHWIGISPGQQSFSQFWSLCLYSSQLAFFSLIFWQIESVAVSMIFFALAFHLNNTFQIRPLTTLFHLNQQMIEIEIGKPFMLEKVFSALSCLV